MKTIRFVAAASCLFLLCHPAQGSILNGGFETGTLEHWTIEGAGNYWRVIPHPDDPDELPTFVSVAYPFEAATNPFLASRPSVVTGVPGRSPVEGSYMLMIDHRQFPVVRPDEIYPDFTFTAPDGLEYMFSPANYSVGVTQTLSLRAGDQVSGWAAMDSWDSPGFDDVAWVSIDGQRVWRMDLDDLGDLGEEADMSSPWQQWTWTAPSDGLFELSLFIAGDDQQDSRAFFDAITVRSVPEGWSNLASLWLLGFVVGAAEICRRRSR